MMAFLTFLYHFDPNKGTLIFHIQCNAKTILVLTHHNCLLGRVKT